MKMKNRSVCVSLLTSCLLLGGCASEAEVPHSAENDGGAVSPLVLLYEEEMNRMRSELEAMREAQDLQNEAYEKRIELLETMLDYYEKQAGADVQSPNVAEQLFTYRVENGIATVTGYNGTRRYVTVPATLGGAPVRVIGDAAFRNGDMEEIYLPESVEKIGWFAFQGCQALRLIQLSANVSSIEYDAFSYCSAQLKFRCPANSYAARYAESCGIPTV